MSLGTRRNEIGAGAGKRGQEGKDHADAKRLPGGQPRAGLGGPGARGLQAEPRRAQRPQARESQPRPGPSRSSSGCLGRSPRGRQGTRAAGPPRPSQSPQAPACPGRASPPPADLATSLRL